MEIVIEQNQLQEKRITYQEEVPTVVKCRKCKADATLMMQVHDDRQHIVEERPPSAHIWPHDSSVTSVYLCTECGSMRARWNQG